MTYNRLSDGVTDIVIGGDTVRLVQNDDGVLTNHYAFNNGASSAFYPAADSTRKLGQASNL